MQPWGKRIYQGWALEIRLAINPDGDVCYLLKDGISKTLSEIKRRFSATRATMP